jgi:uncharacterized RDD family membrane protein YckC
MISGHELATRFLEGRIRGQRHIITPEGVSLPVSLADLGERATAFLLDVFFWSLATIAVYLILVFSLLTGVSGAVAFGIGLFIAFILRNFYFIHFELSWQGATPGKRLLGLRTIARNGGPLLPGAVIARNLTREVETFLPLGLLNSLSLAAGSSVVWERLSLVVWILLLSALPLFNRDRLRAGDIIAGTTVIALPRRALLGDLAEANFHYNFTDRQLRAYGAFELQILEELLRHPEAADATRVRREVRDKIAAKIGHEAAIPDGDTDLFLSDFYTAQRAFLEREQLFGRRRDDKNTGAGNKPPPGA